MIRTTFNENDKLWSGLEKQHSNLGDNTIGAILLAAMKQYPNKIAQVKEIDFESRI